MNQGITKRSKKHGVPPGTLIYTGEHSDIEPAITLIRFNADEFEETAVPVKDIPNFAVKDISWINVDGLSDISIIEAIGSRVSLHQLVMEDILNINQRPKVEFYDDYIFIVLKMVYFSEDDTLTFEQVSLILTDNCVISFQEKPGDVFEPIRSRIRSGKGVIRRKSADYLCYCLIDAITDNYFSVIEDIGEDIEELEEEIITSPGPRTVNYLHELKRNLIFMRKSVWPLREITNSMEHSDSTMLKSDSKPYFRDVYDHTIQIMDTIESNRELVSGLLDIYLSSLSNRMNEVMKVLTIIATIFIPLTFIAGVYGMNFHFMPELGYKWAYPASLGLMIIIGVAMVIYFRRKKWL